MNAIIDFFGDGRNAPTEDIQSRKAERSWSPAGGRNTRGTIHVRAETSKVNRDRVAPLERIAEEVLESVPPERRKDPEARVLPRRLMRCRDGRYLERATARLGPRRLTWQKLRQWCCSILAARGVPMPTVQRLAGHSTMQTTARYYVAVADEVMLDAVVAVDIEGFVSATFCPSVLLQFPPRIRILLHARDQRVQYVQARNAPARLPESPAGGEGGIL